MRVSSPRGFNIAAMTSARRRVPLALATLAVSAVVAAAADLHDDTRQAYDKYAQQATQRFVERARGGPSAPGTGSPPPASHDGEVVVYPAREDGIIGVTGGLLHHWAGSTFIDGVTLKEALELSYDYDSYHTIYHPVLASRLMSHDGDTYRVVLRIRE